MFKKMIKAVPLILNQNYLMQMHILERIYGILVFLTTY